MIGLSPIRLRRLNALTFEPGRRYGWSPLYSQLVLVLSLLLPLVALFRLTGLTVIHHVLLAIGLTAFWQYIFARNRGQKPGFDLVTTALLFALLLPSGFNNVQLILGISFGIVVGEQLYGGRGYSFLHPVIAGLAFLLYSFPTAQPDINGPWLSAAMVPSSMLLLIYRWIDWRALAGLLIGVTIVYLVLTHAFPAFLPGSMILGGALFASLDPAVGTSTQQGRWWYGALVGALVVLFDSSLQSLHAIVFASLLGSVAAPLIDWLVIRLKTRRITASHG